ncbi:MAG: hypothetical protein NTV51_24095 [Verrucomicrobia bacterium]|nr:hypothetical protein [Verrucomicrobiota bacterium]
MGAKTCLIAFCNGDARETLRLLPEPDRAATRRLVEDLFPSHKFGPDQDASLAEAYPRGSEVYAGCFPDLSIVSAAEFAPDRPSTLDRRYRKRGGSRFVTLHAMHSVVDWFAYAIWDDGTLIRSLSVSPDNGVIEDIGERRAFEQPFWNGQRPVGGDDPDDSGGYPLPFHPLELGEAALLDLFSFQLEGADGGIDPFEVSLCRFERKRKWWSFG